MNKYIKIGISIIALIILWVWIVMTIKSNSISALKTSTAILMAALTIDCVIGYYRQIKE